MGVDYDGVGGIGIKLTDEMIEYAIDKGVFTEEEWDDDPCECLFDLDCVNFASAGNSYAGEHEFYLSVPGLTLKDINTNAFSFVEKVKEYFGVDITVDDLKVISDIYIY